MNITCKVIEDLLPLYHDDICSPDTKALVDAHLQNCENCKGVLNAMDAEFVIQEEDWDGQKALEQIHASVTKTKRRAVIKGIALALAAIILGLSIAGTIWYRTQALFYLELSERMVEEYPHLSAAYPHDYLAPTTTGQTDPEPPVWFFPKEYFIGTSQYEYLLRLPGVLDFSGGALSVTPADYRGQEDMPYIGLGVVFTDGKPEYVIDVIDDANDVFSVFMVDGNMNLLNAERYPDKESLAQDQSILKTYFQDIESIIAAAQEMWDLS